MTAPNPVSRTTHMRPDAIVVAASTGGPQALASLFSALGPQISDIPVFVVLHMPAPFGAVVTSQIGKVCGRPTTIASDGEVAKPGHIYFSPGNQHLSLRMNRRSVVMHLDSGPEINFCRPAADILFGSAADVFGRNLIAVVLSGMGSDGCAGASRIAEVGGLVFAQDEATSVVWGMPGAVAATGAAHFVLPPPEIAARIATILIGGRAAGAAA